MQERTAASPSHTAYAIANAHALKVLAVALARALALNMHQHERSTCQYVLHTGTRVGTRAETSHAQARNCTGMHDM
jgi:hypothetical protein